LTNNLIDIHTHNPKSFENRLSFLVGKNSLGIHPWEVVTFKNIDECYQEMLELKKSFHSGVLGIGECGLDRKREGLAPIDLQLIVLEWHMDWAQEVNRPLILHCVGAHSDMLHLLKVKKYAGRILLHDFSGNEQVVKSYLTFDTYFSFGSRLFRDEQIAATVISCLPRERLFLETDDQVEFSLQDIYKKAGTLLGFTTEELLELFNKNLFVFFSDLKDISATNAINHLSMGPIS
jgi:TatD DNase family protein